MTLLKQKLWPNYTYAMFVNTTDSLNESYATEGPSSLREDITVDFVTGLPKCERFNAMIIVADRLGKLRTIQCDNDRG